MKIKLHKKAMSTKLYLSDDESKYQYFMKGNKLRSITSSSINAFIFIDKSIHHEFVLLMFLASFMIFPR